jgi:hypothetical protein
MPRRQDDPQVTDLRRYRQARDAARRRQARAPGHGGPRGERLLGGRPRAGLILALVILAFAALTILPMLPMLR